MRRACKIGIAITIVLTSLVVLAGCGGGGTASSGESSGQGESSSQGDPEDQANVAMSRSNAAVQDAIAADEEAFALLEQLGATEATKEGLAAALPLIDDLESAVTSSTVAFELSNSELKSILSLDVDEDYKTYVQMLIESNDSDLQSNLKTREVATALRSLYQEAAKDDPDEALVQSLNDQLGALAAEVDELDAAALSQSEEASAFFDEKGFVDVGATGADE